ncbi:MAG: hypothetical protein AB1646_23890 [Thermodesulfobacteriota bacterium]
MIARFTRKDFLEALFGEYYKDNRGFILVKSVKQGDAKMHTRYFPNIDILAKEHYGADRDVLFGVCPRERMKAEKEHIKYLVALWADLDIGDEGHEKKKSYFEGPQQAARAIRSFPRAPSIIVESGRGAHLYWLLKQAYEITDTERVEKILSGISEHLRCDTDANLDTVFRLPQTVNTKIPGKTVDCEVKFINPNFRYTLQDFENLGQAVEIPAPRPAHVPPKPSAPPTPPPASRVTPPRPVPSPPGQRPLPTMQTVSPVPPPRSPVTDSMDDSLVIDETIIDELIDDISNPTMVSGTTMVRDYPSGPYPGQAAPRSPASDGMARMPVPSGRMLDELRDVEIALIGSQTPISGRMIRNENGLISVEVNQYVYTIPISSIAFIRSLREG